MEIMYRADMKKTSEFLHSLAEEGIEVYSLCGRFGEENTLLFTTRAVNIAAALRCVKLLNESGNRTKTRIEVCRTFETGRFDGFDLLSENETPLSVSATVIEKASF